MNPAQKIPLPDWAAASATQYVMAALQSQFQGAGPAALFVGGCVRNTLKGQLVDDIDIATKLVPADVIRAAKAAKIKVALTGIEHGTLTLITHGKSFQVTTLRQDIETDGRHARVAFSDDWIADASRRDFTINTLLMDIEGNIYDPLGTGLNDLSAGRVVFVGHAHQRVQEDYLRILRFFRFYARYGQGAPNQSALQACATYADKIEELSVERVRDELKKIIMHPQPVPTLKLMQQNLILPHLFQHLNFDDFEIFCKSEAKIENISFAARFLFLCGMNAQIFKNLAEQYKLTRNETMIGLMILNAGSELKAYAPHALKTLIYHYNYAIACAAALIKFKKEEVSLLQNLASWPVPVFPVKGDDLISRGMQPGKGLGQALKKLEQKWIESDFTLSKADLLQVNLP